MPKGSKSKEEALAKAMREMNASNQEDTKKEEPSEPIPHPPVNYEEFLVCEEIEEWPQRLTSESMLDVSELPDWTENDIIHELRRDVELGMEELEKMDTRLESFKERLDYFTSYIMGTEDRPSRIPEGLFQAPRQEYLMAASEYDAVKLHPSRRVKKDKRQTLAEAAQASRTRNIDYANFPGFRAKELTELPSQLEAPQILNKVTEAQTFNKGFAQLWKMIFLSEASAAMLQDTFWWLFLENFEHNPAAQDKLFTRASDSYIALFSSCNPDIRDKFMHVYPRCLAQAVYLTFFEAFPESHDRFTEEFVSEIDNIISEWVSGVTPVVGSWRKWPWRKLCPTQPGGGGAGGHEGALGLRRAPEIQRKLSFDLVFPDDPPPAKPRKQDVKPQTSDHRPPSVDPSRTQLPPSRESALKMGSTVDSGAGTPAPGSRPGTRESGPKVAVTFVVDDDDEKPAASDVLKSDQDGEFPAKKPLEEVVGKVIDTSPVKPSRKILVKTPSMPAGSAADFERVLFKLKGQTPLVSHHLYMKQLRDRDNFGRTVRRTEIMQQPTSGETMQDIIDNASLTVKSVMEQRFRSEQVTEKNEAKIRGEYIKAIRKLDVKRKLLNDPLEIKLLSDQVMEEALARKSMARYAAGIELKPKDLE